MRVSVVIDGSFLLYKDVYILKNLRRIKQDLKELLINDIKKITKSFTFDDVYFISDTKMNWRKILYKDYKANRKKDESVDWDFVYKTFEEFKDYIKKRKNIKFLELIGLEGDDFISHTIRKCNEIGESCIIISSDEDIRQLVKYDLNKKYINIQWNYKFSDERIYLPENYQLIIEEFSNSVNENVFELDNSSDFVKYVDNLINRTKTKSVKAEEVIVCKLLEGDDGDNIPSVITIKEGKVDLKGRGIGRDGAATVYKLYKEIHPQEINIHSEEFINNLADVIIYHKKIKDVSARDIIIKNLKFNRSMIVLDPIYMPKITYDNMSKHYEEVDKRIIEYEPEDLEAKLEEDDFFNDEPKEIIPEQFNIESDGEVFDPDSFWEL